MKKYLVVKYTGPNAISRINEIDIIDFDFSDNLEYIRNKYNLEVVTNELSFRIKREGFSQYYIDGFGYYLINTNKNLFNNHFYDYVKDLIEISKRDYKLKTLLNE